MEHERKCTMENQRAIMVLKNEAECVCRQGRQACNRNCEDCDLVLPDTEILAAYNMAIKALADG